MNTIVRDNPTEHRYEIIVDGQVAGASSYELDPDRIVFTHTVVDDAHAGQGLGRQLVAGLLADVEQRGLAVVPLCPYVRKVIAEDTSRYRHLVPEHLWKSFGLARHDA